MPMLQQVKMAEDPSDFRRPAPRPQTGRAPSDDAFTELVRDHFGMLVRVARRVQGDEDLARDAAQEALLGLWQQPEPPPNPRAWLVRAVVLRTLFHARGRRRSRLRETKVSHARPEASRLGEPSLRVEADEFVALLKRTIAELDPKYRDPITLYLFEEMDYESIARTLDIPIGTVRSRLNRSRQAIRQRLEGKPPGPRGAVD